METITCKASSLTFRNPTNGYTIFRATDENGGTSFTAVGNTLSFATGKNYVIEGDWKQHPRYGRQFVFTNCREELPSTKKGIECYLSSGLLRGIGTKCARLITQHFGEETIRIIENEPERLLEVPGIGKKRAKTIADSCAEQKAVRDIMIFLKQYDIPNGLAIKIYKQYGGQAMDVLKKNPYRLTQDIRGIGFLKADQIALSMGADPGNEHRLETGVLYVLEQATESHGHTFLHHTTVVNRACEILQLEDKEAIEKAIAVLAGKDKIICEEGCIYLTNLLNSEKTTAHTILRLLDGPEDAAPSKDMMEECGRACGTEFTPAQMNAIRTAAISPFSVLTGGPGTGKTTTTKGIIQMLELTGKDVLLAAPTGRAAKRMAEVTGRPAQTIHRLLGVDGEGQYTRDKDNPLEADALIVDESSMVDIRLMAHLMRAVPDGMKVIMIGDVDQLPSIGPGNVLRDIIESNTVPVSRLTQIFRQAAENPIIRNAHRINTGKEPETDNGEGFLFVEATTPEEIRDRITELAAQEIPETFGIPPEEIQVLCPQKTQACGTAALNTALQNRLNSSAKSLKRGYDELRPGDRVIQTRNNYEKNVMNGELGTVSCIDTEEGKVTVRFEGRNVEYESCDTGELLLAYAITVHKSQGSEYRAAIIPISKSHSFMLQRPLLYTAVTRAKELCVIVGEREAMRYATGNNFIGNRNTKLKERLSREEKDETELF